MRGFESLIPCHRRSKACFAPVLFLHPGDENCPLPLHPRGKFLRTPRAKPPCNRRRVTTFSMSLRTSAGAPAKGYLLRGGEPQGSVAQLRPLAGITTGPRKAARFVGKGDPRERCPALAFGRSWAWRTLGRRGVAIRSPRRGAWQVGTTLGEFVTP